MSWTRDGECVAATPVCPSQHGQELMMTGGPRFPMPDVDYAKLDGPMGKEALCVMLVGSL